MTEVEIISTKLDLSNLFDTKTYNISNNELYTTVYNSNFTFFTKIHSFFSLIISQLELLFDYVVFVPSLDGYLSDYKWCTYLLFPLRSLTKLLVHWLDCWRFTSSSKQAHSTKGMYCLLYTWLADLSRYVTKYRAQNDGLFVFLYFAHWQSARPTFVD